MKLIWNGVESAIHERLKALLGRLTSRQRSVISERFGISDGNPKSIAYLAKQLNTDERAVKRSIKRALQRLRCSYGRIR